MIELSVEADGLDDLGGRTGTADESFASVAEHAPAMLWRGDAAGRCVYLNRAQRAFWGVADDGVASFTWASTLLPEDAALVFGPFGEGMAAQKPFTCEARYRRADGEIRTLKTYAEPRFDSAGAFTGMLGVNVDVTDERRAQSELAENEARLRALADNLPFGMVYQIVATPDGAKRFSFVSSQCKALNGVDAEEAIANPLTLYNLILPEFREAFAAAEQAAHEAMRPFEFETKMRRADGEVRWVKMASAPRKAPNGDVIWDGVQIDIHDVKAAEERRRLLMKEMSHRIKNNLSTVLSIAAQTGRSAQTYAAFNTSFQARLRALAKSHDLLLEDARDSADLRAILNAELGPYAAEGRALTLDGEPVRLSGRAAISLMLVVHELATNAAKYGAYSGAGALAVTWSRDGDRLHMAWREQGGPIVSPPAKMGFGSKLIQSVLSGDLKGSVITRFAPEGFEADIAFELLAATGQ